MFRFILALFLSLFSCSCVFAQIGQEFWFAAPYANPTNGNLPIYMRISSYNDSATVKITIPADNNFVIASFTLAPNSFKSVTLDDYLDKIQCYPFDEVQNKGIFIQSTAEVSAYYELFGTSSYAPGTNSDIFSLKGYNALGNKFYTPFQTHWNNYAGILGYAAFQVVATEDSTVVTITPTNDLENHSASDGAYHIILNKGQTYSARAASIIASLRPTGTSIVSSKPIAVTFIDDSIVEDATRSWDTAGDQLIPVNLLGTNYAAIKVSDPSYNTDRLFICATEDNTTITIGGILRQTINAGNTYSFHLIDDINYIQTSHPVYVFHVAGFGGELGGALLPPLNCNGSKQIQFVRDNEEIFKLTVIVKKGGEGNFKLNNDPTLIMAADFTPIPGFPDWSSAYKEFDLIDIPDQEANTITNSSSDFHLGLINGAYDTGLRYGYFSDLGFLNLGPDKKSCTNQYLRLNAGFGKDSYEWRDGAGNIIGDKQYLSITVADTYTVKATKKDCQALRDTISISFINPTTLPVLLNPDDTSICQGQSALIKGNPVFIDYSWQDGKKDTNYVAKAAGTYTLTITDKNGCLKSDGVNVSINPAPAIKISYDGGENSFCNVEKMILNATAGLVNYKWSTGETTTNIMITPEPDNFYKVSVTDHNGCTNADSIFVDCSKYIFIPNVFTPNGDQVNDFFEISKKFKPDTWNLDVYNRWGKKVYVAHPYNNDWDGADLEAGVYYYQLNKAGGDSQFKGWVQILR